MGPDDRPDEAQVSLFNDTVMAFRIAARDMRGGSRSLWLLAAGVFIGAAAVALVGSATQSLIDGARQGALETVGGDLSLRLTHRPPSPAERTTIAREGEVSLVTELRPMARDLKGIRFRRPAVLAELKGVDANYPLYGRVQTRPASDLGKLLAYDGGEYGAVADPALYDALVLRPGDRIAIGGVKYRLRGVLLAEPDRAFRAFTLGPRIIVANESLPATGLIDEGAEVYFYTRIKLRESTADAARAALARIDKAHPQSGWRMVNAHDGVPGLARVLSMAQVLLLFIGLGVMLVAGAGISAAVRAHTTEKMLTIAILKSLGAVPRVVTMAIGIEVMVAAVIGAALGVGAGAFGAAAATSALAPQVPFELALVAGAKPLLAAGLFGVLVAGLFAWWPLASVREQKSQALFRQRVAHPTSGPGARGWLGAGVILAAIVAVVFWVSPMPVLTIGFVAGALAIALFYFVLGIALSRLAKLLAKGRGATLRLALGSLHRAGAPTGPVVMALGLSLTLLVALDGIGDAANGHMQRTMPAGAPDLLAFSLDSATAARLDAELAGSGIAGPRRIQPFLHARVQALNGRAVRNLRIPGSLSWVIRGDRGVSFAAELPGGARWSVSPSDEQGFSVDAGIARGLGLAPGDTITLNIGGHVRRAPIVDLHHVDWTRLDLDFPIIATPATLGQVPYSQAASLKAQPGQAKALERLLRERFPDMPLIRVADVLSSLAEALDVVVAGLRTAALLCGLAALLVLAGSVLQGLRTRVDEAVLFKVLGARRRQLLGQLVLEFLCLGTIVAIAAVPLGFAIAFAVTGAAGVTAAGPSWSGGLALAAAATLLTITVGLLVTVGAYATPPARVLRDRRL